jgi:hypothetical protein
MKQEQHHYSFFFVRFTHSGTVAGGGTTVPEYSTTSVFENKHTFSNLFSRRA